MQGSITLLLPIFLPMIGGIIAGTVPAFKKDDNTRRLLVLATLAATLGLTVWQATGEKSLLTALTVAPGLELMLAVDDVTRLFGILIAAMQYALKKSEEKKAKKAEEEKEAEK